MFILIDTAFVNVWILETDLRPRSAVHLFLCCFLTGLTSCHALDVSVPVQFHFNKLTQLFFRRINPIHMALRSFNFFSWLF